MSKIVHLRGKWYRWVAFGIGFGFSPIAPGTVGTLLGIPVIFLFQFLPGILWFLGALLVAALSILSSSRVSSELGVKDHPSIVIDEIAGYVFTMALIPVTWQTIVIGFFLFRIFDIIKPPPANWIDRKMSGGLGITADDLVAGIYANLVLQGILYFIKLI
jgi:phosphatidylglycerophosphatase A